MSSSRDGNHDGLTDDQWAYVNSVAKSLRTEDVEHLARKVGFESAQKLAEQYGFPNIYVFFSAPGNDARFLELDEVLSSLRATYPTAK